MPRPQHSLAGALLVAALLASGLEPAAGDTPFGTALAAELRQAGQAVTPTDRNWRAFWSQHLGLWHGRWTRYTPTGSVMESFRSTRDFKADPSQSQIQQVNRYSYEDGRTVEERWSYNRTDQSKAAGFHHPASQLMGTASIRENQRGYPGAHWSEQIAQVSPWRLTGAWVGVTETMGADLSRSLRQATQISWPSAANREIYFPDQIVLSCPKRLPLHQPFSVAVRWLSVDGRLQIIRADYDANARLSQLQHQVLRRAPRRGSSPG